MYKIINYEKKYEEELRNLWVDVCVEEYGFEEWHSEISLIEEEKYEKILIAIINDKVVGSMAYMNKGNGVAEIKRVYIYKEFRGVGIAQKFLDLITEDIKEKGYKNILIETWRQFERGIKFYIKNGFVFKENVGEFCIRYERNI